ncbi:ArsR/SmtB family transcription factor [Ornithinimicrobium avium]|uniref:Transcriptional regulator n=1 Tax=Ornithinimicrobium avium TaxID=2283195 RepID=A0A345NL81_9MICO|nr:metalloregulator ArsR/SmtB family transcription factor [Ornithinimicrobium avium]AXH95789.1 transcriptional regulator [Ornithinimicrobium avium]
MNATRILSRDVAEEYADWFRTLADPTRVQLLAWLARQDRPVPVRDVVDALPLSQSTVSHHLAVLARTCFVVATKEGTSTYYTVNPSCLSALPTAADQIMAGASGICCSPTLTDLSGTAARTLTQERP